MKIQIDGTHTVNKGAELMLNAVLQETERKFPDAEVVINSMSMSRSDIQTALNCKIRPLARIIPVLWRLKIPQKLRLFSLPYSFFTTKYPLKGIDVLLDAGGFQFSDQWNHREKELDIWEKYYEQLKSYGTKIVFLPQAFGPFKTKSGKRQAEMLNKYADIIIAREDISYKYLIETGVDKNKVWQYPDFTLKVQGVVPEKYHHLKNKVCIIPNKRMITHGGVSINYLVFLNYIIDAIEKNGKEVFLLNHEGKGDLELCLQINKTRNGKELPVATGLNALEVKGIIGNSYLVVSSRFHGVASALCQGVPCLATSWSHKYEMLFNDYGLQDMLLKVSDNSDTAKVTGLLSENENKKMKANLLLRKQELLEKTDKMWADIWKGVEQ